MINTWDSYCVTPEEEGSGTKVLDANDQVQPSIEAGTNIVIENGQISASGTLENVQANWQTVDSDDPSYIRNKPQNLVQDADYVHIDNNFTDADVSKLEGIEAGAQVNVKPDWDAVAGSADEILNKPTIPLVDQIYNANSTNAQSGVAVASAVSGAVSGINQVPTSTSADSGKVLKVNAQGNAEWGTDEGTTYTAGNGLSLSGTEFSVDTSVVATQNDLSDYQPVISDLSTIRSGAAAGATAVQPSSLATVATSGSYADLTNKPTIPSGVQLVPTATSADADKVLTVDSLGVPGWAIVPAQSTGLFQATYGTTTYNEVRGAVTANKIVYCYVNGRMAFLAFIGSTNYEFQYYRSNSFSGADSIFVYQVSSSGWTTTERTVKAGNIAYPVTQVNVNGSSAMTGTVANITIPAAPTVDQTYDATSTHAQSGTAVAQAIATIPSSSYTAGEGIAIENDEISVDYDNDTLSTTATTTTTLATFNSVASYSMQGQYQAYLSCTLSEDMKSALNHGMPVQSVTVHIPGTTFQYPLNQQQSLYLELGITEYFNNKSECTRYVSTPVAATFNNIYGGYVVDEQDLTVTLPCNPSRGWTAPEFGFNGIAYMAIVVWYTADDDPSTAPVSNEKAQLIDAFTPTTITMSVAETVPAPLHVANPLPVSSVADTAKVLTVNSDGDPAWITPVNQLPASTASDSGKVLTVDSSGVPAWEAAGGGSSTSAFDTTFNLVNDGVTWRLSKASTDYINLTGGAGVYAYRVVAEITDASNPTAIDDVYNVYVRVGNNESQDTKAIGLKSDIETYPEDPATISFKSSGILNISSAQHVRGQNVYVMIRPAKTGGTAVTSFTGGSVTMYLAKLSTLSGGWQPES